MHNLIVATKPGGWANGPRSLLRPLRVAVEAAREVDAAGRWVALLAAVSTILAFGFVLARMVAPFDNARLEPGEPVWNSDGLVVTPVVEQSDGLRQGDLVIAVEGRPLEAWADATLQLQVPEFPLQFGQKTYTVVRAGERLEIAVQPGAYPLAAIVAHHWGVILYLFIFQVGGLALLMARPKDRAARLLFLIGWCAGAGGAAWWIGLQVSDLLGGLAFWHRTTLRAIYMLAWIAAAHFAFVFPKPHPILIGRKWIVAGLYLVPYGLYAAYLAATHLNAPSTLAWLGEWNAGERAVEVSCGLVAAGAAAASYRASRYDAIALQQWRWIVLGFGVSGTAFVLIGLVPEIVLRRALADWNLLFVVGLAIPVSLGVAVQRYHLFDIDVVLNRALLYAALTGSVVGIYLLVVGYLGSLFRVMDDLPISLLATGVVAVLFQPLRERLQRAVNRLMYGERDEPYAVLSRLGRRLETTLAPEAVLPTVVETIAQALKVPYAAIALNGLRGPVLVAAHGRPAVQLLALPLVHQGEMLGELLLAARGPGESFSPADRRLLADLAHQAGIAAHAVRLTADLQRSRERLVTTREEERRRLRRDLHDGLGPSLASLTLKLEAARNLIDRDPAQTKMLLEELKRQSQASIADIRRLVYDLRPPALDELGLVSAIREHAARAADGTGLDVVIKAPDALPPLPAAVEVAAYRVVLEALTNVVRHAAARRCEIHIAVNGSLLLVVTDDGSGLRPDRTAGVGIASMRERAAELGGSCSVKSPATGGTHVEVHLPLPLTED